METFRAERDWETYVTVLSGDIDGNDGVDPNGVISDTARINGTNAIHVVTSDGVAATTSYWMVSPSLAGSNRQAIGLAAQDYIMMAAQR